MTEHAVQIGCWRITWTRIDESDQKAAAELPFIRVERSEPRRESPEREIRRKLSEAGLHRRFGGVGSLI